MGEGPAGEQVAGLRLVPVGFPLEGAAAVGVPRMQDQPVDPFQNIEKIESDIAEFPHLCRVDGFMPEHGAPFLRRRFLPGVPADENDAEQVESVETLYGQVAVRDDCHAQGECANFVPNRNPEAWKQKRTCRELEFPRIILSLSGIITVNDYEEASLRNH